MAVQAGIGAPLSRIDGPLKVTGRARYAADYAAEDLLHGVIISSAIAKGRIASIDTSRAFAVPGVIEVVTHENRPSLAWLDRNYNDDVAPPGSPFRALYDEKVHFSGQPIAVVIAESLDIARYAATLVVVDYEPEHHNTDFENSLDQKFAPRKLRDFYISPKNRGDAAVAFTSSPIRVTQDYHLAPEHHNPMEMFASTVVWEGDGRITIYDKTQGPQNVRGYLSRIFGFKEADIRVLNPFVGGAFGSALRPQYQVYLAVMAAKMLQRSVRVAMTRPQMFTHSYRPPCAQNVSLGAESDGRLSAIINNAVTSTSRFENYMENVVNWNGSLYACDNASFDYRLVALDTATPGDMRAPGAATGVNLFEIAMDELAYASNVDPLELRIRNYSDKDAMSGAPYTSKALMSCYREAAMRFAWDKRSHAPRSMKEGSELIGLGMATGMWEALMVPATARVTLDADGRVEVASATSDIGTGTYTIMAQIVADTLGVPPDKITVKLGDSDLPTAPVQGGSFTAASVGAAIQLACQAIAEQLLKAASKMNGKPLGSAKIDDIAFSNGMMTDKSDSSCAVTLTDVMRASGEQSFQAEKTAKPGIFSHLRKSRHTHSAVFAEVRVDEDLGVIRVPRIVCAVAAGRILNPKTARSQIIGGVVWGLGMALHEETMMDYRLGRFMNHNLGEYHIPAHADIQDIDVIFVDEPDPEVSPLGIKGVGEIGVVGTAAAIANAIFHATGRRVRDLPITIDKLL